MLNTRVIPCLLLSNGRLVKTIHFENSKYIGDPINAVKIFNEKEVDELIVLDIDASKRQTKPDYDLLANIASECFMPVCYGGGVTSIDEATRIVQLGIEKVAINAAAINNYDLVAEISQALGAQSVVVSVDVKNDFLGRPRVFNASTSKLTNLAPEAYVKELQIAGAGEILLNRIERDGTQEGYDLNLIKNLSQTISIPLIVCGGAGNMEHFVDAVAAGASAVAAGSMFVFQGKHRAVLISYPFYNELENLLGKK
jgi:imidazole glycerol-phosphate synthase subunit HisF